MTVSITPLYEETTSKKRYLSHSFMIGALRGLTISPAPAQVALATQIVLLVTEFQGPTFIPPNLSWRISTATWP
jgi:hypothetical protein